MYFNNDSSYNNDGTPLNDINGWTLREKGDQSFVFDLSATSNSSNMELENVQGNNEISNATTPRTGRKRKPFSSVKSGYSARFENSQIEQIDDQKINPWKVC